MSAPADGEHLPPLPPDQINLKEEAEKGLRPGGLQCEHFAEHGKQNLGYPGSERKVTRMEAPSIHGKTMKIWAGDSKVKSTVSH